MRVKRNVIVNEPMVITALRMGPRYQRRKDISETLLKHLNIEKTPAEIYTMISFARKRGHQIVTTSHGYTLRPKKQDFYYEARLRFTNICGTFQNGLSVISKCKELNGPQYNKLELEYRPKIRQQIDEVFAQRKELVDAER